MKQDEKSLDIKGNERKGINKWWNIIKETNRVLSKVNYLVHTDAVKTNKWK